MNSIEPSTLIPALPTNALAAGLAAAGVGVVLIESPRPSTPIMPSLRPLTCVELTKRYLSCGGFNVLTPYQLFRSLMGRAVRSPAATEDSFLRTPCALR